MTYGATGTHGGSGTYILQSLSKYIDQFIVDYLRVNDSGLPIEPATAAAQRRREAARDKGLEP